jgi:hypothetical protein
LIPEITGILDHHHATALDWWWIDDDMSAQEIEAYQLPAHRCIHVPAHEADVLKTLREQLELLHEGSRL